MIAVSARPQIVALQLSDRIAGTPAATWLSAAEQALTARFRHAGRRAEFVAGRIALKRAWLQAGRSALRIHSAEILGESAPSAARDFEALPDADGRPRSRHGGGSAPLAVSIAHAAGWAAAACDDGPIGIDIVDTAEPAAIPADLPWLAGVPAAARGRLQSLLWGLREAAVKAGLAGSPRAWELGEVPAVPLLPAAELIRRWPAERTCCALELDLAGRRVPAAFVPLSARILLTIVSAHAPASPL